MPIEPAPKHQVVGGLLLLAADPCQGEPRQRVEPVEQRHEARATSCVRQSQRLSVGEFVQEGHRQPFLRPAHRIGGQEDSGTEDAPGHRNLSPRAEDEPHRSPQADPGGEPSGELEHRRVGHRAGFRPRPSEGSTCRASRALRTGGTRPTRPRGRITSSTPPRDCEQSREPPLIQGLVGREHSSRT